MQLDNEKKVLALTGFSHFFSHFYQVLFPTMVLWMFREFEIGLAEAINLGFFMYLFFGLLALPMGVLSDVWNGRSLLIIFLIGSGLSSIVCGLSKSPQTLMVSLSILGVFCSIYHPVGIGLISKACKNRGKALGINGICGNIGIGSAPFLTGLMCYFYGWRTAYIFFGLPTLVFGIVMFFVSIDEKAIEEASPKTNSEAKKKAVFNFGIVLFVMTLLGICYRGTMLVLPALFEQKVVFLSELFSKLGEVKLSASKSLFATILVSFVYFVGIFGQIVGGKVADAYDLRRGYFAFHLLSLPFMFLMALTSNIGLFIAAMVYIFFSLGMQPIENSLVAKLTPPKLRGTSYGLKFFSSMGVGALAVKLSKYVISSQPIENIFYYLSGFIVIVLCGILFFWRLTRGQEIRNIPA